jgi:hypothetical protein
VGGGGGSAAGSTGNVQYNNGGAFAGSNNLFWDNSNTRLGIAQSSPTSRFHLNFNQNSVTQSDANGILLANTTAAIAGTQSISPALVWQGNGWKTTATAASQDVRFRADVLPVQGTTNPNASWRLSTSVNGGAYVDRMTVTTTGATANGVLLDVMSGTSNGVIRSDFIRAYSVANATDQFLGGNATSGSFIYRTTNAGSFITPLFSTYNTAASGTLVHSIDNTNGFVLQAANAAGNYIARGAIQITNLTNTTGSESGDMTFLTQTGGTAMAERMRIFGGGNVAIGTSTNAGYKLDVNGTARVQGALNFNPTNTASGTTGNQTINKTSGTVNIAAAGTTVTVTNSLVSASSIVYAVIRTNDATATIKNVVPAAGSFVINLGAAATAETSIGFFVIN